MSAPLRFRKMTGADQDEVVALLVRAFFDTPFHRYIAPDPADRALFLNLSFTGRMSRALGKNDIDLALEGEPGGRILGIASWVPPGPAAAAPGTAPDIDEEFAPLSRDIRERYRAFLQVLHGELERTVPQPYWDLAPLAVLPEAQGRGIARALLVRKLDEAAAAGVPVALSTQDARNEALYRRFGFVTLSRAPIAPGINSYTMWLRCA